jgi:UDP-glucose:(heptosyl)LPS alpha-1,3-glucosyltransferase
MTIAFLAESLDPSRGGAERALRSVARALARSGERIALVAPEDRLGPEEPGAETIGVALPRRLGRAARARFVARELARVTRERLPGARLVATGKLLGARALWSHGGVHAAGREAAVSAGRGPIRRALARAGRRLRPVEALFDAVEEENARAAREGSLQVLALSERVRADYTRLQELDPTRVTVVRNGVERDRFELSRDERARARGELEQLARATPGEVLGLFSGHAFALKGLDRAIEALAHAPRARLVVLGRGRRGPFERLARRLGVAARVVFGGEVPDVARALGAADVLIHPSRYDPCSLAVLEALAAGLPVIASPEDGSSELVRPEAGWVLADPDDARELATRLRELEDPALRKTLAEGARASARSTDDVARELVRALTNSNS